MIVPLTHHLLALIARDAPTLQKILPAGKASWGRISHRPICTPTNFRDDLQQFAASMPANHFNVVLEITERAMIDKTGRWPSLTGCMSRGLRLRLTILVPDIVRLSTLSVINLTI